MKETNQLYQKQVRYELSTIEDTEHSLLNKDKVDTKILAFLSDLGVVSDESQCFNFWDKNPVTEHQPLKEAYLSGLQMLLSIGFELHIDSIKNYNELDEDIPITKQFLKVYTNALKIKDTYTFEDYQNCVDDYFALGFKLGIRFEEIIQDYRERF